MPEKPSPGWTRIAPGVYDDNQGGMHLVLPELLAANGYADTPENRAMVTQATRDLLPGVPVTEEP